MIEHSFLFNRRQVEKIIFANFLSKFKLLIEKRELWGKLKKKEPISTTDNDKKKIPAQIEDRTFQWLLDSFTA